VRSGIGRTFQKPSVFDELTVVENVDLAASFRLPFRALLRRRGEQVDATRYLLDDLEIDFRGQRATRAGVDVELTTKEFVLLAYLARNAGKVVGRAELTEHVWDENHDPASNAVEVYINRLRKKIDSGGRTPLIQTRRGAGYYLAVGAAVPPAEG